MAGESPRSAEERTRTVAGVAARTRTAAVTAPPGTASLEAAALAIGALVIGAPAFPVTAR